MINAKTKCLYKQGEHLITFSEDNIKIGTKSINNEDIYHIDISYITSYEKLFKIATVVTATVATLLFFALFTDQLNVIVALIVAFIVSIYAYFIKPYYIIKKNQDKYIKMLDIFHGNKHDIVVIKPEFNLDFKLYTKLKKSGTRKRVLRHYLTRLKQSRKYLVSQMETNLKDSNVDIIYEKYSTVATQRYRQECILPRNSVAILNENYHKILGKDLRIAIKISAITLVMIIAFIIHIALSKDFNYQAFF